MKFKLIMALVSDDKTEDVLQAACESGATGSTTISSARGEGLEPPKTFLGLSVSGQRDVLLFLVEGHLCRDILETVATAGAFYKEPGSGIAFQLNIEDAVSLETQIPALFAEIEDQIMAKKHITTVSEVMTPSIHVVEGVATVREAIDLMNTHKVSSLVINRRHEGDEFGIIVIEDIAEKVIDKGMSPDRTNVYEIMSKPVVTVDANMDIRYAIRLLGCLDLSRILVTDGVGLVGLVGMGMVTLRDMVLRFVEPENEAASSAAGTEEEDS